VNAASTRSDSRGMHSRTAEEHTDSAPRAAPDDRPWGELEVRGDGAFLTIAVNERGAILGIAAWDEFREVEATR
jgi:hypothetical protein